MAGFYLKPQEYAGFLSAGQRAGEAGGNAQIGAAKAFTPGKLLNDFIDRRDKQEQQAIENARQEELMGFKRNAEQRIIDEEKAKAAFRKRLADPGQTAFDSSAVNTVDKTVQKAVAGKDFIPDNADKYNAALVAARANGTEVDNKLFGMDDAGLDANKMNALYGDARVAPRLDPAKYEGYIIGQGRDLGIDPKEIAAELAIQKTQRPAKADTTLQDYANKLLIKDSIEGGSGGTKSKNSNSSKKYDNTTWESVRSKVDGKDLTPYGFNFMPGSDTSNFYKFLDVAESKGYSPKQSLFAGEMAITEDALGKGFDYDKALVNLANEEKPGSNTTAANLGGLLGGGTTVKYNGAAQGNLALAEQYPELLGRSGQVADTTGKGDKPIIGKSTVTGSMYDGKTVERDPSLTLTQQWNNPGAVKAASQTDKNAKWQGQVGVDSQGHAIFDTAENGYRAQAKNLITQVGKKPTVTDLIKGNKDKGLGAYATGNQDAYIKKISKDLGIDADTVLTAENVKALMKSMSEMEAGKGGDLKALEAGYDMAVGKEDGTKKALVDATAQGVTGDYLSRRVAADKEKYTDVPGLVVNNKPVSVTKTPLSDIVRNVDNYVKGKSYSGDRDLKGSLLDSIKGFINENTLAVDSAERRTQQDRALDVVTKAKSGEKLTGDQQRWLDGMEKSKYGRDMLRKMGYGLADTVGADQRPITQEEHFEIVNSVREAKNLKDAERQYMLNLLKEDPAAIYGNNPNIPEAVKDKFRVIQADLRQRNRK